MNKNMILGIVNASQYAVIPAQVDNILKWIQLGLAILCSLVLIAYRLWSWYKEAKKDGKITKDEIQKGIDIVIEGGKEIKNQIEDSKEK